MSVHTPPDLPRESDRPPAWGDPLTGEALQRVIDDRGDPHLVSASGRYPIRDGIPRLMPGGSYYAAAFGEQWNRWRRTQLDSHTGTSISRDRLLRCLGTSLERTLIAATDTVDVLEVGCGAGRFTEILLSFPHVRTTSLDLSSAVEANVLNFPIDERHRVVQADIEHPPFVRGDCFDIVMCLGVIQHTPSPEATIQRLFSLMRPGGWLIFDHYRPEWRRLTKATALALRPLIKRLPPALRFQVCEYLVTVFLPIHRAVRRRRWAQYVLSRISPITAYYHAYPMLPEHLQREWAVLDTHDGLADWYKHLRTKEQINAMLRQLGATDVEISLSSHGVEARCRKPAHD